MSQQLELLTENPSQWSTVVNVTPEIQKREIKPFVVLALKELEGVPDSRTSSLVNADKYAAVRAVVRHAVRLRSVAAPAPGDVVAFLQGLRFSPECVSELSTVLCTEQLYASVPAHLRVKPGLVRLHWKIDVSLSQTTLARSQPGPERERAREIIQRDTHVILSLSLSDGQTRTHRLSVAKLHELRFVVASALKSMIVLEKRRCMRRD